MNKQLPTVSVIVTTKNNESTISECLLSIAHQDTSVELIVVDNKSIDKTVEIAGSFTSMLYTFGPERSAQRNYGVARAKGEYILIIDSDMVLKPDVVSQCLKAVDKEHQAIIIPEVSFGKGFWAKCKTLERSFYKGIDWIEAPRFFTKSSYKKVRGYDEDISGGEDWDLRNRIQNNTRIAHAKTVIRHDEGSLTLSELLRSRKYYAKGFAKQYNKAGTGLQKSGLAQATSVFKLFFEHPIKLFRSPIIGLGMIFMKLAEFSTLFIYSKL